MHPRFATALNSTWFQSQLARQTFLVAINAVIGGRLEKRRLLRPGHRIVNYGAGCSAGLKCMWPRQPSCSVAVRVRLAHGAIALVSWRCLPKKACAMAVAHVLASRDEANVRGPEAQRPIFPCHFFFSSALPLSVLLATGGGPVGLFWSRRQDTLLGNRRAHEQSAFIGFRP